MMYLTDMTNNVPWLSDQILAITVYTVQPFLAVVHFPVYFPARS